MAQRKQIIRDALVQVLAADGVTWIAFGGRTNLTVNPGQNEETVDATTSDSAGNYEGMVMQRGATIGIEAFLMADHLTDAQDPAQARIETLAAAVGYDSLGSIRFRRPQATQWKVWNQAFFSCGEQGGGNNDLTSWSCTVTRSSTSTTAAV